MNVYVCYTRVVRKKLNRTAKEEVVAPVEYVLYVVT